MLKEPIYLDYNATSPVDPRVLEAMLPYFSLHFGNAASTTHAQGWVASEAVNTARNEVADLIGASPEEIIFTSGATEAVNLALKGLFALHKNHRKHIITASTEHQSVLETCKNLEDQGALVSYLPVDREGLIAPEALRNTITPQTLVVAIMYANNETGVIQNIPALSEIAHEHSVFFLSDASQAVGKMRIDVQEDGIDLLCLSGHKLYGPKGIGALYLKRKNPRVKLLAQMHGGSQEAGLRGGTLNVPGIVGLGAACRIAAGEMWENGISLSRLRTRLEQALIEFNDVYVNGSQKHRMGHVSNISFRNIDSKALIKALPHIAFSTGSACNANSGKPSHVLMAMGVPSDLSSGAIRLSLGKYTTDKDIDTAIADFSLTVKALRNLY
jgi:cysteine desulfurase